MGELWTVLKLGPLRQDEGLFYGSRCVINKTQCYSDSRSRELEKVVSYSLLVLNILFIKLILRNFRIVLR